MIPGRNIHTFSLLDVHFDFINCLKYQIFRIRVIDKVFRQYFALNVQVVVDFQYLVLVVCILKKTIEIFTYQMFKICQIEINAKIFFINHSFDIVSE